MREVPGILHFTTISVRHKVLIIDNLYAMSLISKMAIAVQVLVLSALISSGDAITAGELVP